MENRITFNIIFLSSIFLCLIGCRKLDTGGMFVSPESANERFKQSEEWNSNHPFQKIIVPADDYVIFSMSDSHVGETINLDTFLLRAAKENAAAIVMAGDLTTGHKDDYAVFQQHLLNADTLNLFPVAGNHDLYFNGWEQFHSRFGTSTFLFTVKTPAASDLFICIESGSGTLGSEQINWLKNILENKRADYRHCVLFTHTNFFREDHAISTNPPVEEIQFLMELFTKCRVDMLVAGHEHEKSTKIFGNTTYIVMDALLDNTDEAGYLKLSIKNENIVNEFVNF